MYIGTCMKGLTDMLASLLIREILCIYQKNNHCKIKLTWIVVLLIRNPNEENRKIMICWLLQYNEANRFNFAIYNIIDNSTIKGQKPEMGNSVVNSPSNQIF